MTVQTQVKVWVLIAVLFLLFLMVFSSILLPFIAGMALAYSLDPLADRLEKWGLARVWASAIILISAILIFVVLFLILVPVLLPQLVGLLEKLPSYVDKLQEFVARIAPQIADRIGDAQMETLKNSLSNVVSTAAGIAGELVGSIMRSGIAVLNAVGLLVVTPVVAFYLLLDWDKIVARVDTLLPRQHAPTIRKLWSEVDTAIAGFIRGQGLVMLILGTFYALALTLLGLNFGIAIGLIAGLMSFVPYVGVAVGFVLSMGVALVQFWPDWGMVLAVFAVFAVGQVVEGNFLQPKLVGDRIGVHAVWLMFALFAFGFLLGFVGLLLAVPLAAVLGVLVRFAIRQYLESGLYLGKEPAESTEVPGVLGGTNKSDRDDRIEG